MVRLVFAFIAICLASAYAQVQTIDGKIKITVGTTSGCGDTVRFIGELVPVYEKYGEFLELEFVPWGKTERVDGALVCQFGENDCWANRLHRCALDLLKGNQEQQLNYMACEFSSPHPAFLQQSVQCALNVGLSVINIDYCMATTGDALEGPAEEISRVPMQVINFVPFILFNDAVDLAQSTQARERLESVICFALSDDPASGVTHCQI